MISESIQIVASTPPADLPHATAAAEVSRLPTYLSALHERDDGTDYVVTSTPYRDAAGNRGRVYFSLDETTNAIVAIQTYVGGAWTNWKIDADSIADGAITTPAIADSSVTGVKMAAAAFGDGLTVTDTTEDDVTSRVVSVAIDDNTIKLVDDKLTMTPVLLNAVAGTRVDFTFNSGNTSQALGGEILAADLPAGINLLAAHIEARRTDAEVGARCFLEVQCVVRSTIGSDFVAASQTIELFKNTLHADYATPYIVAVNTYVATGGLDRVWFYVGWTSDNSSAGFDVLTGGSSFVLPHGFSVS